MDRPLDYGTKGQKRKQSTRNHGGQMHEGPKRRHEKRDPERVQRKPSRVRRPYGKRKNPLPVKNAGHLRLPKELKKPIRSPRWGRGCRSTRDSKKKKTTEGRNRKRRSIPERKNANPILYLSA